MITLSPEEESLWASIKTQQNELQDNTFMNEIERELYQQKLKQFEREHQNFNPKDMIGEVPTLDHIDKELFQKKISQEVFEPFIIKDFLNETKALQTWTVDYLTDIAGLTQVSYSIAKPGTDTTPITSTTLIDAIKKQHNYIHNTSQIFKEHPRLLEELDLNRLKDFFHPLAFCAVPHLFLGNTQPGIPLVLHAANETNGFMMIEGKKRWTLIDPKYSFALRAQLSHSARNAYTDIQHDACDFNYFEKDHPLFNRTPKYISTIEAGDLLVFGPWWWHMVDNLTTTTIAVATRWVPRKRNLCAVGNPIFHEIQKNNKEFQAYSKKFIKAILDNEIIGDDILNEEFQLYHQQKKKK